MEVATIFISKTYMVEWEEGIWARSSALCVPHARLTRSEEEYAASIPMDTGSGPTGNERGTEGLQADYMHRRYYHRSHNERLEAIHGGELSVFGAPARSQERADI